DSEWDGHGFPDGSGLAPRRAVGRNDFSWSGHSPCFAARTCRWGARQDTAMKGLLEDLRIVELSAFVAAPLGGMTMAQMGAEVIRIAPMGGGIDFRRWPVAPSGMSLYWAGLNKEKRSVALALDRPEGRELARAIITAPGPGGGIVLTNLPPLRGLDF